MVQKIVARRSKNCVCGRSKDCICTVGLTRKSMYYLFGWTTRKVSEFIAVNSRLPSRMCTTSHRSGARLTPPSFLDAEPAFLHYILIQPLACRNVLHNTNSTEREILRPQIALPPQGRRGSIRQCNYQFLSCASYVIAVLLLRVSIECHQHCSEFCRGTE